MICILFLYIKQKQENLKSLLIFIVDVTQKTNFKKIPFLQQKPPLFKQKK